MVYREAWRSTQVPQSGDLVLVHHSHWHALPDGGVLRVCEEMGWADPTRELVVAPRHRVATFWGPIAGRWSRGDARRMSTSGGPFRKVAVERLQGLRCWGPVRDRFWRWKDVPRAGGGIEYLAVVTLWSVRRIAIR
jgi:hypothetical protein